MLGLIRCPEVQSKLLSQILLSWVAGFVVVFGVLLPTTTMMMTMTAAAESHTHFSAASAWSLRRSTSSRTTHRTRRQRKSRLTTTTTMREEPCLLARRLGTNLFSTDRHGGRGFFHLLFFASLRLLLNSVRGNFFLGTARLLVLLQIRCGQLRRFTTEKKLFLCWRLFVSLFAGVDQ